MTITGPAGTVRAVVEDHGPNCGCPQRGLDASEEVFLEVVGSLGPGVVSVEWSFG